MLFIWNSRSRRSFFFNDNLSVFAMTMRFLMSVNALALATIFSFSLADIFSDGDLLSAESLSTDSNFFFNDDWQDSEDLTLAFNDVVYPADPDTNFIAASTCGGGDGNLNKLRLRRDGGTSCLTGDAPNEQKDGVIVPEVFQPGEPVLDRLEATTKAGSGKCVLAPYLTNVCCQGFLGVIYSMGPPRVWSTVDNCYTSTINLTLSSSSSATKSSFG